MPNYLMVQIKEKETVKLFQVHANGLAIVQYSILVAHRLACRTQATTVSCCLSCWGRTVHPAGPRVQAVPARCSRHTRAHTDALPS